MQAVHSLLLHTGRVLCVDWFSDAPDRPNLVLVNPADGSVRYVASPQFPVPQPPPLPPLLLPYNLFCAGHSALADGGIVFRGGPLAAPFAYWTAIYTPDPAGGPGSWEQAPDERWPLTPSGTDHANVWRFYPTLTTRGDGSILVTDGWHGCRSSMPETHGLANVPTVLRVAPSLQWKPLYDAEYRPPGNPPGSPPDDPPGFLPNLSGACTGGGPNSFALHWYPFMFLLADGSFLCAGGSDWYDPSDADYTRTRRLDPALETWSAVSGPQPPFRGQSAVMYQKDGRTLVMKAGGPDPPNTDSGVDLVYQIDVTDPKNLGQWVPLAAMSQPRVDFYLIPLPDGKILAINGQEDQYGPPGPPNVPRKKPDLYDPYTDTWTRLDACQSAARLHHNSAVLLPDGSVFVAGGDSLVESRSYQIYKPPYFFAAGGRPIISACPDLLGYGESITLQSPQAAEVTKARLIRLGAATHSFDHNTRMLELESLHLFGNALRIAAPKQPNEAPPGYYMLFVCTGPNGAVPSEAKMIRLAWLAEPPPAP